jgi:hypothetical protein
MGGGHVEVDKQCGSKDFSHHSTVTWDKLAWATKVFIVMPIYETLVWNLLHVILLAFRILGCLVGF